MTDASVSNALALRASALGFDALRDNLPSTDPHHPSPDAVTVARRLTELSALITDLADEVLLRSAEHGLEGRSASATVGFAAAIRPACEAASALGAVALRLSVLDQEEHLHGPLGAKDRRAAGPLLDSALGIARGSLRETAESLRVAAATVSLPSLRTQAALLRSVAAASPPRSLPPAAVSAAAPQNLMTRGR
ncbi:hypothetical protein JCM4814A_36390 [Streptomyces phaeofaciens JCM 4814]|uniref:Uncharacterized protein n=1 Tax=Streptomyces phaeofaciens TaxID=68254 RepID=A0A918HFJ0_9ACTN|nr:hypothetical protein [Streptomyces phaeofaciens]GGT59574.1 hypothetical protein GCM10010226_41170 [Streptomyces phaeofaciens]